MLFCFTLVSFQFYFLHEWCQWTEITILTNFPLVQCCCKTVEASHHILLCVKALSIWHPSALCNNIRFMNLAFWTVPTGSCHKRTFILSLTLLQHNPEHQITQPPLEPLLNPQLIALRIHFSSHSWRHTIIYDGATHYLWLFCVVLEFLPSEECTHLVFNFHTMVYIAKPTPKSPCFLATTIFSIGTSVALWMGTGATLPIDRSFSLTLYTWDKCAHILVTP